MFPPSLKGAATVLRPSGRFVFSVPHPATDTAYRVWERDDNGRKISLKLDRYFETGATVCHWSMPRLRVSVVHAVLAPYACGLVRHAVERRVRASTFCASHDRRAAQIAQNPALEDCARMPYFLILLSSPISRRAVIAVPEFRVPKFRGSPIRTSEPRHCGTAKPRLGVPMLCDSHVHFFSPGFFDTLGAQLGLPPEGRPPTVVAKTGWQDPASNDALADRWVEELDRHSVARAAVIASVPGDEMVGGSRGRASSRPACRLLHAGSDPRRRARPGAAGAR